MTGWRSRPSSIEELFRSQDANEGLTAFSREADAGVHRGV